MTANTNYTFSYYLANQNTTNNSQIQALINGNAVGGLASAVGQYSTNGWQKFSYSWNSGASTTADLSLANLTSGGIGNDFGIDTINFAPTVVATPEPSTYALMALGLGAMGFMSWRRKKGDGAALAL